MDVFRNIIVTDIKPPKVVHAEKGRVYQTTNRAWFALALCISGQLTYTMNDKKYVINQSNAAILPKGGVYSRCGDGLFPVINFEANNLPSDDILVFPLQNPQECINDFEKIKKGFLNPNNHLKTYSDFYKLLRKVFSASMPKETPLDPMLRYIEENISNPDISNTALAKQMGISEIYFRKLFAAHYNTTPRQYILELRIQKAKQLLTDTLLSVTEISQECGFSSVYHFCQTFKKRTGLTPREYAQQNRTFKI